MPIGAAASLTMLWTPGLVMSHVPFQLGTVYCGFHLTTTLVNCLAIIPTLILKQTLFKEATVH